MTETIVNASKIRFTAVNAEPRFNLSIEKQTELEEPIA